MTDQTTAAPRKSTLPATAEFADYMGSGWAQPSGELPGPADVAAFAAARRQALSALFPGRRLIVPAARRRCAPTTSSTSSGPIPRSST